MKKRKKHNGRDQKLHTCLAKDTLNNFVCIANEMGDEQLVKRITESRNEVILYHKICRLQFTNAQQSQKTSNAEKTEWHLTRDIYKLAFEEVCSFVSKNIIKNHDFLNSLFAGCVANHDPSKSSHVEPYNFESKLLNTFPKKINVVTMNGKYGHCCSYRVLEELETEATFAAARRSVLCPEDIIPSKNLCTGLAFDNFDRFMDTATGNDTLHDTVGIIFQNIVNSPASPRLIAENEPSTRKDFELLMRLHLSCSLITKDQKYVQSPLRLTNNNIKEFQFLDLAWSASHYLKLPNMPNWVINNSMIYRDNSVKLKRYLKNVLKII
ncbi:unnamed protein product [Brassicogethes aeneus]|uniref:Uncharacterized protein n=1 Tax=Brassicogethes aeneus TaxID=1431903 RepID=A0A9P0B9E2_BRAAE|nr:unnamed protein product [Brassicogethes aeneus]